MEAVKFLSHRLDSAFSRCCFGEIFSSRYYEVSGNVMFHENHIVHISKIGLLIPLYNTYDIALLKSSNSIKY